MVVPHTNILRHALVGVDVIEVAAFLAAGAFGVLVNKKMESSAFHVGAEIAQ